MASCTLYLGDCLEVMPTIPASSVDAIIADWPYGTTACKWDSVIPLEPLWRECKRVIKPGGAIVLTASQPFTSVLVMSNPKWFRCEWVWEKDKPTGFLDANRKPLKAHESICVFSEGRTIYNPQKTTGHSPVNQPGRKGKLASPYHNHRRIPNGGSTERYPRSVQRFNTPNSAHGILHPSQKPVALMEYLIKTYTSPGDLVLDNTMGSGSTGEACLRTERRFIGIEKDPGYFEVAKDRLERVEEELRQAQIAKERQPYLMAEVA